MNGDRCSWIAVLGMARALRKTARPGIFNPELERQRQADLCKLEASRSTCELRAYIVRNWEQGEERD